MAVIGNHAGGDWTENENDLIIADHFEMLRQELAGERAVKSQHNDQLQRLTGRSRSSIEYKHRNISAVLQKLGLPWVFGYKPLPNFQNSLIAGVERYLSSRDLTLPEREYRPLHQASEAKSLFIEPPPALQNASKGETPELRRLIRKFDPALRDARNRALGKSGEEFALSFERTRLLNAGRGDLARKVDWVSESLGDGAGYDILSFTERGDERLLEVKTTVGHSQTPFFISANECALSEERPNSFRIFRLYDFARTPRAFELAPPLKDVLNLRAENYRASFD